MCVENKTRNGDFLVPCKWEPVVSFSGFGVWDLCSTITNPKPRCPPLSHTATKFVAHMRDYGRATPRVCLKSMFKTRQIAGSIWLKVGFLFLWILVIRLQEFIPNSLNTL